MQIIRSETTLWRGGLREFPGSWGKGQFRARLDSKRFGYCIPNKSWDYLVQGAGQGAGLCNRFELKDARPAP
jgi:hypothetical protein